MDRFLQSLPGEVHDTSQRKQTLTIESSKGAAQEYKQAARDEENVAVAVTEMSRAEMRERMGALENQAAPTWTSHQVTQLNEMIGVARRRAGKPDKKVAQ